MGRLASGFKLLFANSRLIAESFLNLLYYRIRVSITAPGGWIKDYNPMVTVNYRGSNLEEKPGQKEGPDKSCFDFLQVFNKVCGSTPWRSTCMVRVLAAHRMLRKRKIRHAIHFGVKKGLNDKMEAHSWLTVGGQIFIGAEQREAYIEIGVFDF